MSGAPSEEYQCKAKRRNGRRCRKYSLRGSDYCAFHGGRRRDPVRMNHLPMFYSKQLSGTLQDAVERQLEMDTTEQASLWQELALIRTGASQSVAMFNAAMNCKNVDNELRLEAAAQMAQWLGTVKDFAEAAGKLEHLGKDKISVHHLRFIVAQMTRIMHRVCGEDFVELAEEFERLVRTEVKMPHQVTGTDLTPDEDVTKMDSTVPYAEEDD